MANPNEMEDAMAEGRKIERETILEADPDRVWEALTDESLLRDWFAEDAELEPEAGGEIVFGCDDGERRGTVLTFDELRELSFTWSRGGAAESVVTFTLEPLEIGTRLVVTEEMSPVVARAPAAASFAVNEWQTRLAALELCLGALVFA